MTLEPAIAISRRTIAAGLLSGVCVLCAVVFARRSVGAAQSFSSGFGACCVAAVVIASGLLAANILTQHTQRDRAARLMFNCLAAVPGLLLGLALIPTRGVAALSSLITLFLLQTAGATLADVILQTGRSVSNEQLPESSPAAQLDDSEQEETVAAETVSEEFADDESKDSINVPLEADFDDEVLPEDREGTIQHPSLDPDVMQWMTRTERDGADICEGAVKVRFGSRVKQVAIHLPFVPPFESLPEFEAEPLDDVDVEIAVTSTHGYGIRFEVTRKGPLDQPVELAIGYGASAPLNALRAA